MENYTTAQALAIAEIVFDKYPTLPDDWEIQNKRGAIRITYVYTGGDGELEFDTIRDTVGADPERMDDMLVFDQWIEVGEARVMVTVIREVE